MLFDMIHRAREVGTDTKVERRIVLPTELILRASCGCSNHSG
jgi:hypothetical protein